MSVLTWQEMERAFDEWCGTDNPPAGRTWKEWQLRAGRAGITGDLESLASINLNDVWAKGPADAADVFRICSELWADNIEKAIAAARQTAPDSAP